jgi:uncharacterized glyoxalase superfamily protein PhnB
MLTNRSMPMSPVIPVLADEDVEEAVEWLCKIFGFTERWRAGSHRAQLAIGDAAVAVTDGGFGSGGGNVMVRVEDVDAHYAHASAQGARFSEPPVDHPYGERQYTAVDLGGHTWTFSQSIADVAPEDWGWHVGGTALSLQG